MWTWNPYEEGPGVKGGQTLPLASLAFPAGFATLGPLGSSSQDLFGDGGLQKSAQINSPESVTYVSLTICIGVAIAADLLRAWKDAREEREVDTILQCQDLHHILSNCETLGRIQSFTHIFSIS